MKSKGTVKDREEWVLTEGTRDDKRKWPKWKTGHWWLGKENGGTEILEMVWKQRV